MEALVQRLVLLTVDSIFPSPTDLTPQLQELGLGDGWEIQHVSLSDVGGKNAVVVAVVLVQHSSPPPAEAF